MPPVALIYALDASNNREGQEQPSNLIAASLEKYLDEIMDENGAGMADSDDLRTCSALCVRFMRWGVIASLEIGAQRAEIRNYGRHSVADWMFHGDLSPMREALDADYALLTVFKQARETTGRQVLNVLGGGYTVGKQIDIACVADLRDGHMVWCASKKEDRHDLGEDDQARSVLAELLRGLFRVKPPRGPSVTDR